MPLRSVRERLLPWLLFSLLAGCASRPDWPVLHLADPGLPRLSGPEVKACAARLSLGPEVLRPAHPSNFGVREPLDVYGRRVPSVPQLIVLHESVLSAPATINLFRTAHPRDEDQVSYHLLLDRSGRRLRIVPDAKRAYGAGMSAFGDFTVRMRPTSPGSINQVALHLSLETPADGRGDGSGHSGYTSAQYLAAASQVLLWQATYGIPMSRLTTHAAVDRSHTRTDPRSFRWEKFDSAYRTVAAACGLTAYDNGRASY